MSRSASFAVGLLFLLTALVAAAWGAHRLGLTEDSRPVYARASAPAHADPACAYAPGRLHSLPNAAEIAEARASFARLPVCTYTPGRMFAAPDAAQVAEARAGWRWPAQVCLFDPSRGFGAFPTAAELSQTRGLLWGFNPWMAGLGSLLAAIGTMSLGHGLLVGSLSIFNPAFIAVGWWLLLPEIALAQAGWIGAASLATATLGLLAPRYVRRRASVEAMRRAPRGWLTPKRVALVGGGWMMTVGVLAGVYPNIAKLIPQIPGVTVASTPMPKIGGRPAPAAASGGDAAPAATTPAALTDPVASTRGLPPLPPAATDSGQGQPQAPAPAPASPAARMGFGPSLAALSGGGGTAAAASPDVSADPAGGTSPAPTGGTSAIPAIPTTSLASIATYLPPSTPPSTRPSPTPAPGSATPPAPAPAPETSPPPAPVQIAPNDEGRSAIAETPIIDEANPLPASPDAVLPVGEPAPVVVADETPRHSDVVPDPEGPQQPQQPDQPLDPGAPPTLGPANPGALDGDTTPVPEPGMLGLFGLAVLALARRRGK